jgi:hypothetical protein
VRIKPIMVLLVEETAKSSLKLLYWLNSRGCLCQMAQSYRDACNLVSCTPFVLVLSQYQLPDRTAFPVVDRLRISGDSVFLRTRGGRLFMVKGARARQAFLDSQSSMREPEVTRDPMGGLQNQSRKCSEAFR